MKKYVSAAKSSYNFFKDLDYIEDCYLEQGAVEKVLRLIGFYYDEDLNQYIIKFKGGFIIYEGGDFYIEEGIQEDQMKEFYDDLENLDIDYEEMRKKYPGWNERQWTTSSLGQILNEYSNI